jgi:uncharacterized protein (DUF305 family)
MKGPTRYTALSIAAALLPAALLACAGRTSGTVQTAPPPVTAATSQQSALAKARADSASRPYTEADIRFMSGMISHHSQAILMAGWAPSHGASDAVRRLAARIINAQQDEIALMQQWLADRRQPVPEPNPKGMKMVMNGMEHLMLMPGMLNEAQLHQLDQARGSDFDLLFLQFMIQHHRGAVSMVNDLFSTNGAGQDQFAFKLASDVNVDQTTEIARMQKMLAALLTSPQ